LEAQRKIIEAEGTRDSQKILAEGLTPAIIKIRSIEAFRELARSTNSKVIITDGKTPYLISGEQSGGN
jgi:regulator of protease activity HflC (stomatin/prohibitin superfamily)